MLSYKSFLFFMSLVLIFSFGTTPVRFVVGVSSTAAPVQHLQRRLPAGWQVASGYLFVCLWLLAATHDFDSAVFSALSSALVATLFSASFLRAAGLAAIECLRLVLGVFLLAAVLLIWAFGRRVPDPTQPMGLYDELEYMGTHDGEHSPWWKAEQKRRAQPPPQPQVDLRFNHFSDQMIFVNGPGGGFVTVYNGDFEEAIRRKRGPNWKEPEWTVRETKSVPRPYRFS